MKIKLNYARIASLTLLLSMIIVFTTYHIHGGDALSGKIEGSEYYVFDATNKFDKNGNKLFLSVSKNEYYFNLIATYFLFAILPLSLFFKVKEIINNRKNQEIEL
jgi:hypothetical protein